MCGKKRIAVVSHLFRLIIHVADTDGTVTLTALLSASSQLIEVLKNVFFTDGQVERDSR